MSPLDGEARLTSAMRLSDGFAVEVEGLVFRRGTRGMSGGARPISR